MKGVILETLCEYGEGARGIVHVWITDKMFASFNNFLLSLFKFNEPKRLL